jgi:hypothetical protein
MAFRTSNSARNESDLHNIGQIRGRDLNLSPTWKMRPTETNLAQMRALIAAKANGANSMPCALRIEAFR